MKTLYDAVLILKNAISKSDPWVFSGSLDTASEDHCPVELSCFFRWIIQGPNTKLAHEDKCSEVQKRAMHLAQSMVAMCLTDRQVKKKNSQAIYATREMPQQVAVSIAIHQAIRSKEIINLHRFRMAVEYNCLLRMESEIEKTVIKRMQNDGDIYLPPDIIKGRRVFFAVDNIDFSEDTPDGKRTLHGTAMAIYQKTQPQDVKPLLR